MHVINLSLQLDNNEKHQKLILGFKRHVIGVLQDIVTATNFKECRQCVLLTLL